MIPYAVLFPAISLVGFCILLAVKTALRQITPKTSKHPLLQSNLHLSFFLLTEKLFPSKNIHPVHPFLSLAVIAMACGYGMTSILFLLNNQVLTENIHESFLGLGPLLFFSSLVIIVVIALASYALFHLFSRFFPIATLKLFSPISSFYLLLLYPIIFPFVWIETKILSGSPSSEPHQSSEKLKKRLLELLKESEFENILDPKDHRLVKSLAQFGDLVAREIMVPRSNIVSLRDTATVEEALKLFIKEGYSRIPVFNDSIDHIIGVLLYKDVVEFWYDALEGKSLEAARKSLIKPLTTAILYTPENKKIQDLFQEIRTQKIHLAIVVNEYGCTEGLLTIEDILEELVGTEILDEHDEDEEILFKESQDKGWIVDAKMSIVDVEKQFGLQIPHNPEYETIGGFISWKMGIIPAPETIIHVDQFDIKVLASSRRQIFKVKITSAVPPHPTSLDPSLY